MSKLNRNYIAVLDIGSSKIACLIAQINADGEISVLGTGHQISQGIKSGVITDVKLAEESIRAAVATAEKLAGTNIFQVIVNLSGNKISSKSVMATINVNGREITNRDISKLISQACEQNKINEKDIIHCIPSEYSIDESAGIRNPEGMYGNSLKAHISIIYASSSNIINLTNCLAQCHLNVEGFICSSYASGFACLTDDEKELGVILLDFGATNVSISCFKDGNLIYASSVSIGGQHITNDLAIGLSTDKSTAERIKTLYGNVFLTSKDELEIIDMPQTNDDGTSEINNVQKSAIINIILPRVEEILEKVANSLDKNPKSATIGSIVITGGASQLSGLSELIAETFGRQVRLGNPKYIDGMPESARGTSFATSVGMLILTAKQKKDKNLAFKNKMRSDSFFGKTLNWLKENF